MDQLATYIADVIGPRTWRLRLIALTALLLQFLVQLSQRGDPPADQADPASLRAGAVGYWGSIRSAGMSTSPVRVEPCRPLAWVGWATATKDLAKRLPILPLT